MAHPGSHDTERPLDTSLGTEPGTASVVKDGDLRCKLDGWPD